MYVSTAVLLLRTKMEPKLNGSDALSVVDAGTGTPRYSGGQPLAGSCEVNITNCYQHLKNMRSVAHEVVKVNELIAYWMMGGYLGPIHSVEEAYLKGHDVLHDLVYKKELLKFTDQRKGLIGIKDPQPAAMASFLCMHQGLCSGSLGMPRFFTLEKSRYDGNIMLTDGLSKREWQIGANPGFSDKKYLAHFNPTADSLKPLLENHTNLHTLVLRGCKMVAESTFPLELLSSLEVLQISGSPQLTIITENTISQLIHLHSLHLSDLLIESLPDDFFSELSSLKKIIVSRCSELNSLPPIGNCSHITYLDLSHCTALQEIVYTGGSLRKLSFLDLSFTSITTVPPFLCENKLSWLLLRASKLQNTFYKISSHLKNLDLSRTQIQYLRCSVQKPQNGALRTMILQGCTSLKKFPSMQCFPRLYKIDISGCEQLLQLPTDMSNLANLVFLNLSGCRGLETLREGIFGKMSRLLQLDLSRTNVKKLPSFANLTRLEVLSLEDLELGSLKTLKSLSNLVQLDLKGLKISCMQELKLDFLESLEKLQILNLSETSVAKLPNMSKLASLRELILANCQRLKIVPDLQTLPKLEVLDLSLADGSVANCQAEIQFEAQGGGTFSPPTSLLKLILTNRSGVHKLFPLASLGNLEFLDLGGTDVTEIPHNYKEQIKRLRLPAEIRFSEASSSRMGNSPEIIDSDNNIQARVSKTGEIYIVSSSKSEDEREDKNGASPASHHDNSYSYISEKLAELIDKMQENFITNAMANGINSNGEITIQNRTFKLHLLHSDLKFIQRNLIRLESSRNCKTANGLLQKLIAATTHLSIADFLKDATILMKLVGIVVKLKILFPRPEAKPAEASKITKKKEEEPWWKKSKDRENGVTIPKELSSHELQNLRISYDGLTPTEQQCLLCFSIFPYNEDNEENARVSSSLMVKKRMLIYWWAGERFIGPHSEDAYLTEESKPVTIEEMGERVLGVLTEKGFIQPVMEKGRETTHCRIHQIAQYFVIDKAKEVGFFDFNQNSSKLSAHFTRSKRACLLKAEPNFTSSCKLWESYTTASPKNLEIFRNVHTLLNADESMVDIKPEWFSEMKSLLVLLLGSWRCQTTELIEVRDHKFLEELKCMKQLRLLSLQGWPTLKKLPDSVCKLTNLIILDLRECSYLEELPAQIGSLGNLTHLDMTNCRLLCTLPKGIRLLSKLEVLKGFVMTNLHSGKKACVLADLLSLKKLRKLSMIVDNNTFPNNQELQVLKDMGNLRKLKITWETGSNSADSNECQPVAHEESSLSKWKNSLKCWGHQSGQRPKQVTSKSKHLDNLDKLELWCFPGVTPLSWLDPSELKKLEKLYIMGGSLTKLHGGTNQSKWNVTTLRLKYLAKMDITWRHLMTMFPNLTYLERHECPNLVIFPCDSNNVWRL